MHIFKISTAVLCTAVFILAGCADFSDGPEEDYYGSGVLTSQQRSVESFTGVRLIGIGTVVVTQSTTEELRVEADDNLIDRVTTTVQNGVLLVGMKRGSYHRATVRVYASMKTVSGLELIGAGDIRTSNSIQTNSLSCQIIGAGDITVSGTTTEQHSVITGTGLIRNFNLASSICTATISGTGTIEVTTTQRLDAVVSGVGTIIYDGNPPTVYQLVTGVGSIKPR